MEDLAPRWPPEPMEPGGVAVMVRGLWHTYAGPAGPVPVLSGLDLDIAPGSHVALCGRSGTGKTTLLALLGGLMRPQQGRVEIAGLNLAGLDPDQLAAYRRATVGFVFQHFGLLDTLTARENVELAMALGGQRAAPRRARAGELLEAVGLAGRAAHRPGALSGGERQRVAIARALANRPRLMLADEPTGNLDVESAAGVLDVLERVCTEAGASLVVVTHNPEVAARAPVRLVLDGGRLQGDGRRPGDGPLAGPGAGP